jgi:hypothetical protein
LADDNRQFIIDPDHPRFDFLVLAYDGQQVRFYVNNKIVASRNISGQIVSNDFPMVFGQYAGNYPGYNDYFNGIIDDIRIYNRALNNEELQILYNENSPQFATPDLSTIAGSSLEIPVNAVNLDAINNIIAYQFDYSFDSLKMQYQDYSLTGTMTENGTIQINQVNNKLSVAWAGQSPLIGSGAILKLRFRAIEEGTTTPILSNCIINTDTVHSITNGKIIIGPGIGDVDNNGHIQAYDAALALQYSVGLNPLPDIDPLPWEDWRITQANVDGQDGISAYDAALILQYTAGIISTFPVSGQQKSTAASRADVSVSAEDGYVVFRSGGDMLGLNIILDGNPENFGTPQILEPNMLVAENISSSGYSVGLATASAPAENSIILKIPMVSTPVQPVILTLKINNMDKQVDLGIPTGLSGFLNNSIEMYPNPANTTLYFRNLTGDAKISIYDLQGRELVSKIITDNWVDISNLEYGIYTVRIEDVNKIMIRKLIKQ